MKPITPILVITLVLVGLTSCGSFDSMNKSMAKSFDLLDEKDPPSDYNDKNYPTHHPMTDPEDMPICRPMDDDQGHHMGNDQDHHMGNGQGHHMGNGQGHHMGNGQGHHMGNDQDHHMDDAQGHHMDNAHCKQAPDNPNSAAVKSLNK